MISNRQARAAFRIAPAGAGHTVTALRPWRDAGVPDDTDPPAGPEAAPTLADDAAARLQAGGGRHLMTMTWRPRTPVAPEETGRAMRGIFPVRLRPGDLLVMHEHGEVWQIDAEGRIERCERSFADLLGYPAANALGEIPRSTVLRTNRVDDLLWMLSQTVRGWGRREETCLRVGRPVRITAEDFAKLAITLIDHQARARSADPAAPGIRDILTDVAVCGLEAA